MDKDEYEYAVRRVGIDKPENTYIIGNFWSDREDRTALLDVFLINPPEGIQYKLIKRRKAGPEENA